MPPKEYKIPFLGKMTMNDLSKLVLKVVLPLLGAVGIFALLFFNLNWGYKDGKIFFGCTPPETKINVQKGIK